MGERRVSWLATMEQSATFVSSPKRTYLTVYSAAAEISCSRRGAWK